jgi:hypothetical protein
MTFYQTGAEWLQVRHTRVRAVERSIIAGVVRTSTFMRPSSPTKRTSQSKRAPLGSLDDPCFSRTVFKAKIRTIVDLMAGRDRPNASTDEAQRP